MNGLKAEAQTGACACGAVIFRAKVLKRYGVCHCRTCRRWVGGPWMAVNAGTAPIIAGQVKVWDSSEHAERGSCKKCGAAVFFHRKATGVFFLALGLFDDQEGWERASEIFVDEQPDCYALVDGEKQAAA